MAEHKGSGNATEAPTSGSTADKLAARVSGGGLTPDEVAFVTLLHQYYGMYGKVMTVQTAMSDYMFNFDEFEELLNSEAVGAALKERGVLIKRTDYTLVKNVRKVLDAQAISAEPELCSTCGKPTDEPVETDLSQVTAGPMQWQEKALDPLQIIVANTILDLVDTRSQKKKLQDLNVSTAKYQAWLKDANFQTYMLQASKEMLKGNEHEVYLALIDKVRMGDQKAISTFLAMQGIYTPESNSNAGSTGTHTNLNVQNVLIRVLEIITEETDQQQAAVIGERIRAMIGIQDMAHQLANPGSGTVQPLAHPVGMPEDHMPVIAKTRELSPQLQKLMDNGVGDG